MEVEYKCQQAKLRSLVHEYTGQTPPFSIVLAITLIAAGGLAIGKVFLEAAVLVAGFFTFGYALPWLFALPQERQARDLMNKIEKADKAILEQLRDL